MSVDPTLIKDLESLRRMHRSGQPIAYVFFPDAGSCGEPPTASCLSQWGTSPFEWNGQQYQSAEQAMMHAKATLFGDFRVAEQILSARTSFQAKLLGGRVQGFSEPIWEQERVSIVVEANLQKFASSSALKEYLLSTGDAVLVEASPTDLVWGMGLDESERDAHNPERWPGLNLLGFALMEVRRRLRGESVSA